MGVPAVVDETSVAVIAKSSATHGWAVQAARLFKYEHSFNFLLGSLRFKVE